MANKTKEAVKTTTALKQMVNPFESGGVRNCFTACMEKETNVTQWCKTNKKPNGDTFGLERMLWAIITTGTRPKGKYGLKWEVSKRVIDEKTKVLGLNKVGDVLVRITKMYALDATTAAKHGWNVYDAKLGIWLPANNDHAQRQGFKTAAEYTAALKEKLAAKQEETE
jgi:hypothetical protein